MPDHGALPSTATRDATSAAPTPIRLLVVTEHYWPEEFRITDLVAGLRERGHHVEVLTAMPSYPLGRYFDGYTLAGPYAEVHEGITVNRVPVVPRGRGQAWRLAVNYASFALTATARVLFTRRWDAALVFQPSPVTTCIPALALRSMAGAPVAVWVQDLWPESISASGLVRAPWLVGAVGLLSRRIYSSCDLVLGQSRAFLPRLESCGVSPERLDYLPNWAEEVYKSAPERGGQTEPWERGFPIVFAGNLGRVQALETVLEAARLTRDDPDLRWVFIGDGPLREALAAEAIASGVSDRVFFLGRKPVEDMPRYFAKAGAMLVSLKHDETMALTIPSKVQSYLAAGVPVLGSLDGEGARVIEESGSGWAAAASDAAALAANVRRMKALSGKERCVLGRRGRAYYDREFDRALCITRLERRLVELSRRAIA
jgi:glycosyltransferase involved in cell wall biosynthesis